MQATNQTQQLFNAGRPLAAIKFAILRPLCRFLFNLSNAMYVAADRVDTWRISEALDLQ